MSGSVDYGKTSLLQYKSSFLEFMPDMFEKSRLLNWNLLMRKVCTGELYVRMAEIIFPSMRRYA